MEGNLETAYKIIFDRDTIQAIPEFPMFPTLQEPSFSRLVSDRTDREDEQLEPARNIIMGGIWLY